jgi:short-subunit dehydrogenase
MAFTTSLRASYRNQGISASAIVPGFVEAGIYTRLKERSGCAAPPLLGTSRPEQVSQAVLRAIESDAPEIIVNPLPVRPLIALNALAPRLGEWVIDRTGANKFFREVVEASRRSEKSKNPA